MADGLSSGKAVFITVQEIVIPQDKIDPAAQKPSSKSQACVQRIEDTAAQRARSGTAESYEQIEIISTHLDILDDPEIKNFVETAITKEYDTRQAPSTKFPQRHQSS